MLIDTSARREMDRMELPSQSIERIWARLATGSLFMPYIIMNFMLSVKDAQKDTPTRRRVLTKARLPGLYRSCRTKAIAP